MTIEEIDVGQVDKQWWKKTIVVGRPKAPGGGVAFVFNLENEKVWVQKHFFVCQDIYAQGNAHLGESVTAQSGEHGW